MTKPEWVSGGKDGKILLWDANLSIVATIDIVPTLTKVFGLTSEVTKKRMTSFGVRSVCFNSSHSRLLVGTHGSDIVEIDRTGAKASIITQGHAQNEVQNFVFKVLRSELLILYYKKLRWSKIFYSLRILSDCINNIKINYIKFERNQTLCSGWSMIQTFEIFFQIPQ